jgi:hypothetical protein
VLSGQVRGIVFEVELAQALFRELLACETVKKVVA